jgi:hypothetical protein
MAAVSSSVKAALPRFADALSASAAGVLSKAPSQSATRDKPPNPSHAPPIARMRQSGNFAPIRHSNAGHTCQDLS